MLRVTKTSRDKAEHLGTLLQMLVGGSIMLQAMIRGNGKTLPAAGSQMHRPMEEPLPKVSADQ